MKTRLLIFSFLIFLLILLGFLFFDNTISKYNSTFSRNYRFHDNYIKIFKPKTTSLYDFPYILNSSPCRPFHKVVILVTSYIGHVELRSAHRRALPLQALQEIGVKRVFLLAKGPKHDRYVVSQESVDDESARFDDLVQGDFDEAYRNLTLKHVMGLRWAQTTCPHANFIIKLDDDIVFNLPNILKHIYKYYEQSSENFLLGYVIKGMQPIHNQANKWFVTKEEYSKSYYPPFLSGWMYVTTPKTVEKLVNEAYDSKYFWIDDVFVTGILASKADIKLIDISDDNLYLEYYELLDCCLADMINKDILCEFSLGPNGGHEDMLVNFVNAVNDCSVKHCSARLTDKPLKETCVSVKKSLPVGKGKPQVNMLKL